jgi:predicted ester cyclase/transcriptional regulator with XRE-family HTH domain
MEMATITTSQFAYLLRKYRQRAKISQQELSDILRIQYGITLYGSDISKLERDERKPPKIDATLALIQALHLNEDEAQGFLEAGNYPPSVSRLLTEQPKEQKEGSSPEPFYPPTTPEQALSYLRSPFPSWQLSGDGNIIACNRLAMWLFLATRAEDLLDVFVFEVFTRPWNLARILMTGKSNDFWFIKLQVLNWMEKHNPSEAIERAKRIILENPTLNILYEHLDKLNLDNISFYNYALFIQHPEIHHHYLHFHVKIWITRTIEGNLDKFIIVYEPHDAYTSEVIAQKYLELNKNQEDYMYQTPAIALDASATQEPYFPSSYPSITHDPFFQITSVNQATRNMIASLAFNYRVEPVEPVGMNFFELISSDPIKRPVEALGEWTRSAILAVEGLKYIMRLHLKTHPKDKGKYQKKIADLKENLDWFAAAYAAPYSHNDFPETKEKPIPICSVDFLVIPSSTKSDKMTLNSWVLLPNYRERDTIELTYAPDPDNEKSKKLLEQLTTSPDNSIAATEAAEEYKTVRSFAETIRTWVDEAYNTGNFDLANDMYASDYILHDSMVGTVKGIDGLKRFVSQYRSGIPDLHLTIEEIVDRGDLILWRYTARGTHTGVLFGMDPTNKPVEVKGTVTSIFKDGKWAEDWHNPDPQGLVQLGILPRHGQLISI